MTEAELRARICQLERMVDDGEANRALLASTIDAGPAPVLFPVAITPCTRAEQTLRVSEARFRAMIEKSHDGITLLDGEARTIYQSPAVERLLGYSADDAQRMTWQDFVEPEQWPKLQDGLSRLLRQPSGSILLDFPIRHRDGSRRWLELTATNLLDDPDVGAIVSNFRDVTERRSMEHQHDGFFRMTLDLLCIASLDGRLLRVNPAWETTVGWSADELTSRPWLDFVHPDDRLDTEREGARLAEGSATSRFENRFRCKDGSYRRLQWSSIPSVQDGVLYATARDVTEQRAAAERDRLLFAASPVPMYLVDGETTRFLDVNDAALAMYGYTRTQMLALVLADIIVEAQLPDMRIRFDAALNGQPVLILDRRHRTCSGAVLDVEVTGYRLDVAERPAILSVVLDVTKRKRVEAELRASERRYRKIVDNTSEGIWMYDASGTTTFMNPRMAELLGVTVEQAVGTPVFAFMHEAEIPDARKRMAQRIQNVRGSGEFRLRRNDGRDLWVSLQSDPLLDDAGQFENALVLVTDITDKREAAAALQRSNEELRQAQKMEAVGLLAGGIAHDFNNLLTVILSSGELLLDELPASDPLRADVDEICKAGVRASQLTKQLLAFSRKQILTPAVVDLNDVIGGIEKMLQTLLGEEIELSMVPAPALGRVHADAGQLEQVIMNLVVNARDAMPTGGRLTIETSNAVLDAGPYTMVAVTDTGIGMDRATTERIFEPFFTTKDKSKGTGLGLSTVYGIVQQSGGHISVHSELGHGTTFNVYLPRTDRSDSPETAPLPLITSLRGSETILLVEDDAAVRAVIYSILRRNGYTVVEAQNGGEALMLCEQHDGDVHLLLTDVVMPRITGRQLATRLAKLRPGLKVVYMSGYTDDAIVHHGVLDPGIEFLPKPVVPDALLRKLRGVLDSPPPRDGL